LPAPSGRRPNLSTSEAGFGDVWSFLALVLVPNVVWWRAAGSTNIERFVATDITRHTLARLWWRAQLFTWGLEDPEEGWAIWSQSEIGEAELDQIQTRRGGYGRSPRAFRSLVKVYPAIAQLADQAGINRRTLWRQSYLRWVLRLGAFTDFAGMPEADLQEDLLALAHQVAAAAAAAPAATDEDAAERDEATEPTAVQQSFDALPLSTLVVHLTEAVRAAGEGGAPRTRGRLRTKLWHHGPASPRRHPRRDRLAGAAAEISEPHRRRYPDDLAPRPCASRARPPLGRVVDRHLQGARAEPERRGRPRLPLR